jgi:hypothetical protein
MYPLLRGCSDPVGNGQIDHCLWAWLWDALVFFFFNGEGVAKDPEAVS